MQPSMLWLMTQGHDRVIIANALRLSNRKPYAQNWIANQSAPFMLSGFKEHLNMSAAVLTFKGLNSTSGAVQLNVPVTQA